MGGNGKINIKWVKLLIDSADLDNCHDMFPMGPKLRKYSARKRQPAGLLFETHSAHKYNKSHVFDLGFSHHT
jgi:hypothetical protein